MLESSGSASLCFHKASLLLVIFLNSLFSYQGSSAVLRQLLYSSRFLLFCQPLFYLFQRFLSEDLLYAVFSAFRPPDSVCLRFLSLKAPASLSASVFTCPLTASIGYHRRKLLSTDIFNIIYIFYFIYTISYLYMQFIEISDFLQGPQESRTSFFCISS